MRFLIQRVRSASVTVEGETIGAIGSGLLVFVGIGYGDDEAIADRMVDKLLGLRILEDSDGKMNVSLADVHAFDPVNAGLLVVSQFTLYADARKGRRPSFTDSAPPDIAVRLIDHISEAIRSRGIEPQAGRFGAEMQVTLVNDGPVTIWLDSAVLFPVAG